MASGTSPAGRQGSKMGAGAFAQALCRPVANLGLPLLFSREPGLLARGEAARAPDSKQTNGGVLRVCWALCRLRVPASRVHIVGARLWSADSCPAPFWAPGTPRQKTPSARATRLTPSWQRSRLRGRPVASSLYTLTHSLSCQPSKVGSSNYRRGQAAHPRSHGRTWGFLRDGSGRGVRVGNSVW